MTSAATDTSPGTPATSAGAAVRPLPRNTVLAVSGVSFRQEQVRQVRCGDDLVLRHDTSNPRDPHAVSVNTISGELLGYIPAKNDLNVRLAGVYPGGVWSATVAEVLGEGKETLGLRIRIGELIGREDARFASHIAGLRHRDDGYTDPNTSSTSTEQGGSADAPETSSGAMQAATVPSQVRHVRTRTGRDLGELLEVAGNRVRVRTGGGDVSYPAAVVVIDN